MILPFVLDAASAIFWNVSKKEPKLAVAPLEIKKYYLKIGVAFHQILV